MKVNGVLILNGDIMLRYLRNDSYLRKILVQGTGIFYTHTHCCYGENKAHSGYHSQ